jgi:protein O-GlcNAc transferase
LVENGGGRGGVSLNRGLLLAMMTAVLAATGCKEPDGTLAQLEAQVRRHPDSVENLVALGNARLEHEDYNDAYIAFKRASDLDQQSYEASYGLARAYRHLGDPQAAMKSVKHALHLRPKQSEAHELQGQLYLMLAEPAKAAETFKRALQVKPDSKVALTHLALAYLAQGKLQDAEGAARSAVEAFPDEIEIRTNLALVYTRRKKYDEAETQLRKAIELDPEDPDSYLRLADLLVSNDRKLSEARELAQKSMAIDRGDGAAAAIAAMALHRMGKSAEAAAELEEAAKTNPRNYRIWLRLARVYKDLGQEEAARRAATMAVQVGPRRTAEPQPQAPAGQGD